MDADAVNAVLSYAERHRLAHDPILMVARNIVGL